MSTRQLLKGEWRRYADRVSKRLVGEAAELEVVALNLGDRLETKWVPLLGVVYDAKSNVFEMALKGIDHLISEPREMYVEETERGLVAIEIIAADETRQILRFREPLAFDIENSD